MASVLSGYENDVSASAGRAGRSMEDLPDELVLHILRHLSDGFALLDALPLVCRRWHRLCQDVRLWSNVSADTRFWKAQDDPRLLLHAPALRCLSLHRQTAKGIDKDCLPAAVGRSLAVVREAVTVTHGGLLRLGQQGGGGLLALLWRSRHTLRRVLVPWADASLETPSHRLSFLEVLARIECLEVLHLHVGVKTVLQYSGQLGQDEATVPLRELQIRACKAASKWTVQRAVPEDLVLDLVRRAGAGLRELRLDGRWPVPPRVLQQLDRSQLRDVSAHSSVLGMAAKALRSVERLTLSVMLDQDGGADDVDMEDPDADSAGSDDEADGLDDQPFQEFMADLRTSGMALVSAALARCEAAASLRMLALTVTDVDLAEDENFRVDCRKLVDAFKERRPLVQTQLDFHCTFRAEAY
ncbi:uncharacterized protein LOC117651860 isoform X2 [Thrips palmi]|uniref:Uncharacterized protein LOC117651860 isoform X2 n=1 Tax=Thrips palmi TaxID=161013 RepID=A0A6P9A309_THRPL|nr:uncharacterized protein LOC117651860 isoform X2 [Thrips palmi]XP_034252234.1 uncharacterized protein LOC117651860 isoform X2 [Thrips palmi]XP_034252235.1 uncharacterized protein LOC117651860 isoform X2 [Thrips palmi]XP_034252236.1 uncharacterized protein LOC117651860 isoform X2 [Thrips palmi]XP_034252238.1 uncharacterized protein LOC117651860 isoform X2 [Thrips palmi]